MVSPGSAPGPTPALDFDVTDRAALLRHSAPLFTATWLIDAAGAMGSAMPQLVNSDGEDMLFHRMVFPLAKGVTQKQVAARLRMVPAWSPASAKFWNWLGEPVPALGNKTPRQMAKTRAGRTKVAEWLKYIENMTARSGNEQMAAYSFAWMWDELGVADLRA